MICNCCQIEDDRASKIWYWDRFDTLLVRKDCLFIYNISTACPIDKMVPSGSAHRDPSLYVGSASARLQSCRSRIRSGCPLIHLLCDPLSILPCETGTLHLTANAIMPVFGYEPHDLKVMQHNETPLLVTRTNAVIPLLTDSICKMRARRSSSHPGILVSGSTWPNLRFNVSDVVGSYV